MNALPRILAITSLLYAITIIYANNTYASSISISLTGNVSLNLLKDNANAVFGKSAEQTATIISDHFTGYTLTITGSNDTGRLVNSDGSKYLSSINTAISENTFRTDTQYNDRWGFLPSKYNSIDNNNYQPSPATASTTIDITDSPNSTDGTNGGTEYQLALGAKVTPEMSLDSYGQTFVLAATGNAYSYYLGYTDDQQSLPENVYGNTQDDTIYVSSIKPTKDGWVFQGWCDVATTNNGTACPGNLLDPGDPIDLDGATGNHINLHAVWAKGYDTFADAFAAFNKQKPTGSSYYAMQDITPEICDSIVIGSPTTTENIAKNTLIDTRDNTTYLVAKYADGHCWMRQNLSLTLSNNADVIAYNFETDTTFNYRPTYSAQTTTEKIPWAGDASDGARSYGVDKDKYIGGMDINTAGTVSTTGQPYEKIGVLYNWAAATAQTEGEAPAAMSEVSTSICPRGWRLPTRAGNYSMSVLMGNYGLPTTNQEAGYSGQLQNPLNFSRPGYYVNSRGELNRQNTSGWFWFSGGYGPSGAYGFGFDASRFGPQFGNTKGFGFSVRCVAV